MCRILLLDKSLAKPAIGDHARHTDKDGQHADQTEFIRPKQPGQNDPDDEARPLIAQVLGGAPNDSAQRFGFECGAQADRKLSFGRDKHGVSPADQGSFTFGEFQVRLNH